MVMAREMVTGTFSSPIVTAFFRIVGIVVIMNRILYTMAVYKQKKIERDEDNYLINNFCNQVDHREIGRHHMICLEADKRLASTITFHTIQEVVNDTLYRELHFHTIAQVSGLIIVVMVLGAFHNKYVKANAPRDLPLTTKQVKVD